ncbi:MAG TPA: hypothetical protein PLA20_01155 [Bacilli bacterium]|jgi:hypothetical protein|nr:hypothetical protein [Acholeplasmataceae bacterium]OQB66207.1 MAG: hypothetical protein BWX94_00076 [Tenericutes bacterium ADurb.Bin140]HOE77087.1 hypothetical protein [Bacilli bacterium]HON64018.1 hypothetical protein [Bacilli bacterium]HOR95455.1 hypothetical protein [Bacilli bacterium]
MEYHSINDTSIGRQKEKSLHLLLKRHLCPDETKHEVKINNWIVDIFNQGIITEVQTGNFHQMKNKLASLLPEYKVRIVYPMATEKIIHWENPETGEITSRKSPKKAHPLRICKELYFIRDYLNHPNLEILIAMCKINEYRMLDGYSKNKKKGATKVDQIPVWFDETISLTAKEDYQKYLEALPPKFSVKTFKSLMPLSPKEAVLAIQVLKTVGAISFVEKAGKAYIYSLK